MATPLPDPRFISPIAGRDANVGSGWGPRGNHFHAGIDINVPTGTHIIAVGAGTVIRAQRVDDGGPAGIHIAVQHPSGITSRYLHMSRLDVNVGQQVIQGQLLGLSGNTGRSDGPHLHFELRAPVSLLPAIEAAVGKPTTGWGTGPLVDKYGYGIPSEPWIPVTSIRASTINKLRSYGVVLRSERTGVALKRFPLNPAVPIVGGLAFVGVSIALAFGIRRRRLDGRSIFGP